MTKTNKRLLEGMVLRAITKEAKIKKAKPDYVSIDGLNYNSEDSELFCSVTAHYPGMSPTLYLAYSIEKAVNLAKTPAEEKLRIHVLWASVKFKQLNDEKALVEKTLRDVIYKDKRRKEKK